MRVDARRLPVGERRRQRLEPARGPPRLRVGAAQGAAPVVRLDADEEVRAFLSPGSYGGASCRRWRGRRFEV
jgi:hypothetical protein